MGDELHQPQNDSAPIRSRGWGLPIALAVVAVVALVV